MLVLVLAGCGDAEEPLDTSDASAEPPAVSEEPAEEPEPTPEESEPAEPEPEEEPEEGGIAEHGPPEDAETFADCGNVTEDPPGALILFPSADVPGSLEAGPGPVTVEVVGCSDTFEANLLWEAYHGQDTTPTLEGFTMGGTLGDWGMFSIEETYWTPGDWTVQVFEYDAESGNRVDYDEVTFSVD